MKKEKVLIFGAGRYAHKVIDRVEQFFEVIAVIDNDMHSWGEMFVGKYQIISIEKYVSCFRTKRILIAVDRMVTYLEICKQLKSLNALFCHVNDALCEVAKKRGLEFYIEETSLRFVEKISNNECVFVLTAPAHSNLGDQAQSFCISEILGKTYPNHLLLLLDEIELQKNFYELIYIIKRYIKETDLLFLHSGYRLTNLYMSSEHIVEMMIKLFPNRKMIFLPQTINYTDTVVAQNIMSLIGSNVTIMCRDEFSFKKALEMFPRARAILYPDVVTSLIGQYDFHTQRKGILMVMRDTEDGESIFDKADIQELGNLLGKIDKVDITDTTIDTDWKTISENRKYYIEREIEKYSGYRLIISNRYHGTIFALASNTPVVVLPTKDHKISSGVKWLIRAGIESFSFCENESDIVDSAINLLKRADYSKNNSWFLDNYFSDMVLFD